MQARQLSSAASVFSFQLFGYALSPLVSSFVMALVKGQAEADAAAAAAADGVTAAPPSAPLIVNASHHGCLEEDQNLSVDQLQARR